MKRHNKALHSDKIKLRSLLATLYFAGELSRYSVKSNLPPMTAMDRLLTFRQKNTPLLAKRMVNTAKALKWPSC
jgi:hypothetical protein